MDVRTKDDQLKYQTKTLKDLRAEKGMNRTQFSKYMGIPLRNLEEWESGRRLMPDYLLRLIIYYIKLNTPSNN